MMTVHYYHILTGVLAFLKAKIVMKTMEMFSPGTVPHWSDIIWPSLVAHILNSRGHSGRKVKFEFVLFCCEPLYFIGQGG